MNRSPINRFPGLVGMVCVLLLLSACAATVSKTSLVEERAQARWDTLLSGDLSAAYEYLSPGYRSSVSSLQYQRSVLLMKIRWISADVIESNCEETACSVKILLGFAVHGGLPGVQSMEETEVIDESWLLVDGAWYFVPPK